MRQLPDHPAAPHAEEHRQQALHEEAEHRVLARVGAFGRLFGIGCRRPSECARERFEHRTEAVERRRRPVLPVHRLVRHGEHRGDAGRVPDRALRGAHETVERRRRVACRARVRFPVDRFRDPRWRSRPTPDARHRSSPGPATAACASAARSRSHPGTEIPVPFGERRPLGQSIARGSRHRRGHRHLWFHRPTVAAAVGRFARSGPHRRTRRAGSRAPRAEADVPSGRHRERRPHAVPPGRRHRGALGGDRRPDSRRRSDDSGELRRYAARARRRGPRPACAASCAARARRCTAHGRTTRCR